MITHISEERQTPESLDNQNCNCEPVVVKNVVYAARVEGGSSSWGESQVLKREYETEQESQSDEDGHPN